MSRHSSPSEYRRTLFDRHGPEALDLIRSGSYGVMVFGLVFGAVALASGGMSWPVVGAAAIAGVGTMLASYSLGKAAGGVTKALTASGASTPYENQYSYQQALVMQGKVDEAIASFEKLITDSPTAVQPRIRAAELHFQYKRDARRAAELLREAQRLSTIKPGEDVYASNRLVDLLAGPLGDLGRACVELRRLIDRYPGSDTAARAREALSRIKERMNPEQ